MQLTGQRGAYQLDLDAPRGGGQAVVYPAIGPNGQRWAIKLARDRRASKWIARERDALYALRGNATWLVSLEDSGHTEDGRIFLVLPWFEQSFSGWIQQQLPPLEARLRRLQAACAAVIHLHRSADTLSDIRVHRDIKPDNFLVSAEGQIVLADLGGIKEGNLLAVGSHTALHTPDYAPTEQALPLERAPDPSMDVHALAATIYWALTGAPPAAILARRSQLSPDGLRLCQLHFKGRQRTEADQEEYRTLRRSPLPTLLKMDAVDPLTAEDEQLLRRSLAALLHGRLDDAEALADELAQILLPPLHHALAPDPRQRAGDARRLLAACELAQKTLEDHLPNAASPTPPRSPQPAHTEPVVTAPLATHFVSSPTWTAQAPASPRRWPLEVMAALLVLLLGSAGLASMTLGVALSSSADVSDTGDVAFSDPERPMPEPEPIATLPPPEAPAPDETADAPDETAKPPPASPRPRPPVTQPAPTPPKKKKPRKRKPDGIDQDEWRRTVRRWKRRLERLGG